MDAVRRREADWIARRIRGLLDGGEPIVCDSAPIGEPITRAAKPGDIAILFRALSDVAFYEDALRRRGVDYYLVGGHAFYAQQEIFDLVNLLRTLNSPSDLVSLVGVLRSGFFSLADETLFWLAQHPEGLAGGLFAERLPSEIGAEQTARCDSPLRRSRPCGRRKIGCSVCQLIDEALERTGYDAALLNEFLGERKLANLRKLVEQARGFQRGGYLGLSDFIAELSEFVAAQPDEPLAAMHSEDMNVVRLMTVHQSKGLEFPVVIVPDIQRPTHAGSDGVHMDRELGPLVRMPSRGSETAPVGGYELWRMREKQAEAAELNRLFYVATTRAADYLILSSGASRIDALERPLDRFAGAPFRPGEWQTGRPAARRCKRAVHSRHHRGAAGRWSGGAAGGARRSRSAARCGEVRRRPAARALAGRRGDCTQPGSAAAVFVLAFVGRARTHARVLRHAAAH